jgi:hypothetical protein
MKPDEDLIICRILQESLKKKWMFLYSPNFIGLLYIVYFVITDTVSSGWWDNWETVNWERFERKRPLLNTGFLPAFTCNNCGGKATGTWNMMAVAPAEIRTKRLSDTTLYRCCYINLLNMWSRQRNWDIRWPWHVQQRSTTHAYWVWKHVGKMLPGRPRRRQKDSVNAILKETFEGQAIFIWNILFRVEWGYNAV